MGILWGEFEMDRHKKDEESGVSRNLVEAELCALGHQKQENREKPMKRQEKYKMLKEIDAEKEGKGCSWEFCQMTAVQVA